VANRITTVVVDCSSPERLAGFYSAVLGDEVVDRQEGWIEIGPAGRPGRGQRVTGDRWRTA
jgi:hypothetical protein